METQKKYLDILKPYMNAKEESFTVDNLEFNQILCAAIELGPKNLFLNYSKMTEIKLGNKLFILKKQLYNKNK